MSDELVCIGVIVGSFGVRGDVRVKSFCATPEDIETYSPLLSEDGQKTYSITLNSAVKHGFSARLGDVTTKEQADALHGVRLFTTRDRLPSLPDDEYYYTDLIGLKVLDTGGAELGVVKDVVNHGAGDLLEVHGPALKTSVLLPFTLVSVPTVDLAAGRIIVDPPDGLL
ncbi:MAG: 16S rRNA processing protein RimM [Rhodobacteraceae bacterium]|nr:MAG: 16S rRNA processing protein RimM [Paracoccaceae bacterium]